MHPDIETALKVAWSFHGLPYLWGGDDPMAGFDCSGFVIEVLKSVGKLPRAGDWRARDLCGMFPEAESIQPAMLVFWQNRAGTVIHVELTISDKLAIGASGGGSATADPKAAIAANAYVKVRPFESRAGIHCFRDPFRKERERCLAQMSL